MTYDLRDILRKRLAKAVRKPNGCLEWGSGRGYGSIDVCGTFYGAHRAAMFVKNGVWPLEACHTCDNKRCVDTDHLFDGTRKDNYDDYVTKHGYHPAQLIRYLSNS